jgi:methanogenic corrinoid protein MtbC1
MTDDQINSRVAAIMISGDMTASEIESLILAMTALDRKSVAGILDRSAALRGLEATYTDVVFPFMKRVGLMWQTETISPGYEHFVTGIFRNILIKAIETMEPVKATRPRRILLYLPENEMHELPLLLFTYIAAMEGNEVIYLGQMTPLTSVIEISESWNPDIIVTGAATALPPDPVRYLQQLMAALPGTRIVTGGTFVTIPGIKRIKCVTPVRTSGEFRKFLSGLKD